MFGRWRFQGVISKMQFRDLYMYDATCSRWAPLTLSHILLLLLSPSMQDLMAGLYSGNNQCCNIMKAANQPESEVCLHRTYLLCNDCNERYTNREKKTGQTQMKTQVRQKQNDCSGTETNNKIQCYSKWNKGARKYRQEVAGPRATPGRG